MTAKRALLAQLAIMSALVAFAVVAPHRFEALLMNRPSMYLHAKLVHILAATLFFGNVVIGTLWETRALVTRNTVLIRHTYATVAWLDAFFTAPLVLTAVLSGLMLGTMLGGVFSMGWLLLAFGLFALSGLVWVALDIPSQRRAKTLLAALPLATEAVPAELLRLLRFRLGLNVFAILVLLAVLVLMVHKPALS